MEIRVHTKDVIPGQGPELANLAKQYQLNTPGSLYGMCGFLEFHSGKNLW